MTNWVIHFLAIPCALYDGDVNGGSVVGDHSAEFLDNGSNELKLQSEALASDQVSHSGETTIQYTADQLVAEALARLESTMCAEGLLPAGVAFLFCEDPTDWGVYPEDLAAVEKAGYQNAGYGQRAEGDDHFRDHPEITFRNFALGQRGPLRFVVAVQECGSSRRPLAFFDYFRVTKHIDDAEDVYARAAASREARETENNKTIPEIYIVSKLVADPTIPREAAAMPGRMVAATLRALANSTPGGIYVEAEAQPATQRFVRGNLKKRYILDLEILLNQTFEGKGDGGEPAKLLVYVPPDNT